MKYKEKVIYLKDLGGWVCVDKFKKYQLADSPIKNGFIEVEISMPSTPLVDKTSKMSKLHIISGWEIAQFNQGNKPYQEDGKTNFAFRVGKYNPAKLKTWHKNFSMIDERVKNPNQLEGKNIYRIEWLNNIVSFYFNGKLIKTLDGKAEYSVDVFQIKYILLGRDNRYRKPHPEVKFYNLKIGEYIEDDGSIDPDSPDDTVDDQDDNQGGEEIIIKPEDKEPLSLEETWKNLKEKSKLIALIIAVLFLMSIFFC